MSVVENIDRRRAERYEAAFGVRFSVNGGPEHLSPALNFTSRSLAIRSDMPVRAGDHVDVRFGGLPDIKGEVARVFPEGFAIMLSKGSLAMMTRSDLQAQDTESEAAPELSISSPFIRVNSPVAARALLSSSLDDEPGYNRHFLSILTADPAVLENVGKIWISAETTRWVASGLRIERRGNRGLAVMGLNDWQAHIGAAYGLKLTFVGDEMQEWTVEIEAEPVAAHLETLAPAKLAVNA
ncbi:hypothetical protein [Hyphococcus luteus]|uniref:PilZ domain-containing protein n=1 Tax=Hyphococcus luteus TaxID=2058213 RepID=A0A2S7K2Q2_9PROT|nr:hypothetical protein [Marinicaulis flavus]PQA86784.1 hypothetical protein CW354_14955 [Marinicaulis flavus]